MKVVIHKSFLRRGVGGMAQEAVDSVGLKTLMT